MSEGEVVGTAVNRRRLDGGAAIVAAQGSSTVDSHLPVVWLAGALLRSKGARRERGAGAARLHHLLAYDYCEHWAPPVAEARGSIRYR